MDTFDSNEFTPEQPAPQQPPVPPQETPQPETNAYRGSGAGRKESPYANSPYVMYHQPQGEQQSYQSTQQPQNTYSYQPPYEAPKKPKAPKVKKERSKAFRGIVAAVLTVALVAGSCLITAAAVNNRWEREKAQTVAMLSQQIEELQQQVEAAASKSGLSISGSPGTAEGLTPGQVYAQNVNSVVAISTTVQTNSFYGSGTASSSGSGFILTQDGYVVTNYHVVNGATAITVITHDSTEYPATLVGKDSSNDVAVLKVEATGLPAATLGSSDDLVIGDMVVAIGNPLGNLNATQTVGYVSGKNRDVTTSNTIINMIQTDAAINPGNSGGPLFNMKGEVVGITTAKYSGTTGSGASIEGIGFAIPIDDVMTIISDLVDYGYVTGAYLGVTVSNTDESAAAMFGLPVGAYVQTVEAGGSAERAGIQPKDIIIDLGGHEVTSITSLTRALRNFRPGDTTTVTVIRGGSEKVLDITLDEKPQPITSTNETLPEADANMPKEGDLEEWYRWFSERGGIG